MWSGREEKQMRDVRNRDANSSRVNLRHDKSIRTFTHRLEHPQLTPSFPTARNERDRESL